MVKTKDYEELKMRNWCLDCWMSSRDLPNCQMSKTHYAQVEYKPLSRARDIDTIDLRVVILASV